MLRAAELHALAEFRHRQLAAPTVRAGQAGVVPQIAVGVGQTVVDGAQLAREIVPDHLKLKAAPVDQNVDGVIELARTGDVLHLARPAVGEAHQRVSLFVRGLAAGDRVALSDMSRRDGIDGPRIE